MYSLSRISISEAVLARHEDLSHRQQYSLLDAIPQDEVLVREKILAPRCFIMNSAACLPETATTKTKTGLNTVKRKSQKCQLCNRLFSVYKNMRQHLESVHYKIKRFACTRCEHKTYHKNNLITHMRGKHRLSEKWKEPIKCSDCSFASKSGKCR